MRAVVVCIFWVEVGVEAPVKVRQNTMKMRKINAKYTVSLYNKTDEGNGGRSVVGFGTYCHSLRE